MTTSDNVTRRLLPLHKPLQGVMRVPSDKSLSHRALILAAMAHGESLLEGLLDSYDVRATQTILTKLGMVSRSSDRELQVFGWQDKRNIGPLDLDCGNSGTTMRLLAGVLAAGQGEYTLSGDASLSKRPMMRIADPLCQMGATIATSAGGVAPLKIEAAALRGIEYTMPVASAQVKSSLLLAGVQSAGETVIHGSNGSRDHSERLLQALGADITFDERTIRLRGPYSWPGFFMRIPGDLSAAAYPAALASMVPGSALMIANVGLNPTRLGFYKLLQRMGALLTWQVDGAELGEPWGSLRVNYAPLHGITVDPEEVPSCIDELMLLAVVAAMAQGTTIVRGAQELRRKESDRLEATATELRRLGVDIEVIGDGWKIEGPNTWQSGTVTTHGDHRLEMSLAVAAWATSGARETVIEDCRWSGISWLRFWEDMDSLIRNS